MSQNEKDKPKHGRRAADEEGGKPATVQQGWGEETGGLMMEPSTVSVGGSSSEVVEPVELDAGAAEESAKAAQAQREAELEELTKEVASAPTEYHASMPKLAELEAASANRYAHLQQAFGDLDVSCLLAVLCPTLDDDTPWNPDQMLVQLTSELDLAKTEKEVEDKDGVSTAL